MDFTIVAVLGLVGGLGRGTAWVELCRTRDRSLRIDVYSPPVGTSRFAWPVYFAGVLI